MMITETLTVKDAYKLFHQGSIALSQIESNGIRIDVPYLDNVIINTEKNIKKLEKELKSDTIYKKWCEEFSNKTNLGSDQQLAHVIYEVMEYPCLSYTAKGKPSVSEESLRDVDLPFVRKLFEARHLKKTVATYLKGIRREVCNGYLHPFFNLHTARTYRSSSSSPNWQNLPRRDDKIAELVRRCIIPRQGRHFWEVDFKGIEVNISCCYHKDPILIKYVKDKTKDMHRDTAAELFLLKKEEVSKKARDRAKNQFVFPEFYGSYYIQTAKGLWDTICRMKDLGIELSLLKEFSKANELTQTTELKKQNGFISIKDHLASKGIIRLGNCDPKQKPEQGTFEYLVKEVEDRFWNERFKVYTQWKKEWYQQYLEDGYFDTLTGFRIEGILKKNDVLNYPVQSAAFHCLLWTLIQLQKWLNKNRMKTCLCGQIHDSIEGDSPPDELDDVVEKVERIVTEDLPKHWPWIIVPMSVETEVSPLDKSWHDKKEYHISRN